MLANALWAAQETLHGKDRANSAALPGALVLAATGLVAYRHATSETSDFSDPMKTFLALICVQMVPLVFLELRVMSCPDPMGMLGKFGGKVLLLHAIFLGLRVVAWMFLPFNDSEACTMLCNAAFCAAALVALHVGWGVNRSADVASEYGEAGALVLLALVGAAATELVDPVSAHGEVPWAEAVIFNATSYIEILAFVPAVRLVHKWSKKGDEDAAAGSGPDVQKQATCFFAFLVALYLVEDMVTALRVASSEPLAAVAHTVHFLLTLDFTCFLLAHVYNPDKLKAQLLRCLPDQLWV